MLYLFFLSTDASSDITDLLEELRPIDYNTDPNSRYNGGENLGTWSSLSDVDKFFTKYNHANGYKSSIRPLRLGDYVTINDGTYNKQWMIAGFDMEAGRAATDGTTYNNGYGICFISKTQVVIEKWNTSSNTTGGYKSSYIHGTVLSNIVTKLKTILGSHIVNRNVLLSSSIGESSSKAYTWTTAYATLMSVGQMNGIFASNNNKYDDGEANYKLPVFNYMEFKVSDCRIWTRNIAGGSGAWYVNNNSTGSIEGYTANYLCGVRPLIYLR